MTMRRTHHLRPRGVNRRMDHERCRIQAAIRPAGDHGAFVVDLDQVRGLN